MCIIKSRELWQAEHSSSTNLCKTSAICARNGLNFICSVMNYKLDTRYQYCEIRVFFHVSVHPAPASSAFSFHAIRKNVEDGRKKNI